MSQSIDFEQQTQRLEEALRGLSAGRKAPRLYRLLPAIEQKLAQGISHREILNLLNRHGLVLSERTYKSYLYRYRRRRRKSGAAGVTTAAAGIVSLPVAEPAGASTPLPQAETQKRPGTFEFNAGGLPPELLR